MVHLEVHCHAHTREEIGKQLKTPAPVALAGVKGQGFPILSLCTMLFANALLDA